MGNPKPPSPQNALKRFQFFTGPNGKGYSREIIKKEIQRYAFTSAGNKLLRELQRQQKEQQTGLVAAPKPGIFDNLKQAFKPKKAS